MATHKSDQITNIEKLPITRIKPNESEGRVRIKFFTFTVPTGNVAINDVVELFKLPKGARVLHGRAFWEAMSTGAGAASMSIGIAGSAAKYLGVTSVDSAGESDFANTLALNAGSETSTEETVIATATVEAWAATKKLQGYVLYVKD